MTIFGYIAFLLLRMVYPNPDPPPRLVSREEADRVAQAQAIFGTRIQAISNAPTKVQVGDIFKPGAAFDASAIAPRLCRLRTNFPGEARTRRPLSHLRACLVAAARRTLRQRPYFRDHPPSPPFAPPAPHHTQTPA